MYKFSEEITPFSQENCFHLGDRADYAPCTAIKTIYA